VLLCLRRILDDGVIDVKQKAASAAAFRASASEARGLYRLRADAAVEPMPLRGVPQWHRCLDERLSCETEHRWGC